MTSPVEDLVTARMGLDVESLGPWVFPRLVAERMGDRGVRTEAGYARLLLADPAEWAALAAGLVVPETWFFRGGRPLFDHLAKWAADRAKAHAPVRVLSVPCSTGEEPYSLAIALHDRGVSPAACRVDAVDLTAVALARAAAGRFTAFSFREGASAPRPDVFIPLGAERWELRPEVRERVRFRPGNAADPSFLAGEPPYDLVLCRNLFIYLTPVARERAAANLDRLLAADGLLCLSPAEADRLPPGKFAADGPDGLGLFRRAKPSGVMTGNPSPGPSPLRGGEPAGGSSSSAGEFRPLAPPSLSGKGAGGLGHGSPPSPTPPPRGVRGEQPSAPDDPLAAARRLADAGRLDDALAACERAAVGPAATAAAFALLGAIQLARGSADAATAAFRRALYLDPDDPDALSHMSVLCERRGDAAQAAALRRRLARVETGSTT